MNILFFTPVVATSAIGRMATLVVNQLVSLGHAVTVIRTESASKQSQNIHHFNAQIIDWRHLDTRLPSLPKPDIYLYQIGDYFDFHEGGVHWLREVPGIICLHDFFLGSLFSEWAQYNRQEAHSTLYSWYDQETGQKYFHYTDNRTFIEETSQTAPMTEWLCSHALGVVTHSSWGIERVTSSCPGPVHVIPLCYNAPQSDATSHRADTSATNTRLQLLTIGHANPNKRIEQIIQAIASCDDLKQQIHYSLAGQIESDYRDHLTRLAEESGVELSIAGKVDEQVLADMIINTDMVSCLRWPVLEAASASTIESMLYSKPVMCTNTGFYAEIPDEYIFKVNPDHENDDIVRYLRHAIANRETLTTIGNRAKIWAQETFSAANYASHLLALCDNVLQAKVPLQAFSSLNHQVKAWGFHNGLRKEDIQALNLF